MGVVYQNAQQAYYKKRILGKEDILYMAQVVGVRFERAGKIYYFEVGGLELSLGDGVIVESSRGLDYGTVATPVQEVAEKDLPQPLKPVMRVATIADEKRYEDYKAKEPEAFEFCREQILVANLPMKLIRAAYSFDGSKIVFYFTSDNRVDFRDLVKVLAAHFHARIELRQVGVRDEARLVGGYSSCGRELCCAAFLNGFHPVSIKMAKKQNLALNPAKISGVCGRLMCCLYYEYDENAPDEPETTEKPGCDNNCAACGEKPCARFVDELDLEDAVSVADSDELMPEQLKPRPKNRGGRGGKNDRAEKNDKPGKNEHPARSERTKKPERGDKPEKNSKDAKNNEHKNDKNNDRNREKPEAEPVIQQPYSEDAPAEQGEKKPGGNKRRSRGRRGGRGRGGNRPEGQSAPASTEGE